MNDRLNLRSWPQTSSIVLCVFILAACGSQPGPEETAGKTAEKSVEQDTSASAPDPYPAKWRVSEGIDVPENVYFDSESGAVFVSVGRGYSYLDAPYVPADDRKDGKGRIAKLNLEGKVLEANWATGLNLPSGMCRTQGTLWVADLDEVVGVDIATASIASRVQITNANLNDAACGSDGTVYASDTTASKIYAVKGDKASVFTDDITYPAGLLVERRRLVVGALGYKSGDTEVPGRLVALDLETKQKAVIANDPVVFMGRLESDGNSGYIVLDPLSGRIMTVSAKGDVKIIRQYEHGASGYTRKSRPADIAYVPATHTLITSFLAGQKVTTDVPESVRANLNVPNEGVVRYTTNEWSYEKIAAYDISGDLR